MGKVWKVVMNFYSDSTFTNKVYAYSRYRFLGLAVGDTASITGSTKITDHLQYYTSKVNTGESSYLGYDIIAKGDDRAPVISRCTEFWPLARADIVEDFDTSWYIEYVFANGYYMRSTSNTSSSSGGWKLYDNTGLQYGSSELLGTDKVWYPAKNAYTDCHIATLVVSSINSLTGLIPANATFAAYKAYQSSYYDGFHGSAGGEIKRIAGGSSGINNALTREFFNSLIGVNDAPTPYPIDPSGPSDPPDPEATPENYDFRTTLVPFPDSPTWTLVEAGFCNLYVPTSYQLNELASYLWSSSFDANNFKKMFNNPMDAIMGCHLVPVEIPSEASILAYGNNSTGISMNRATTNWVEFDCGEIEIPEFYGAYLAYDPYTKVRIYLPFIGTHELSADILIGRSVKIIYKVDVSSGACVALIGVKYNSTETTDGEDGYVIHYQFAGSCSVELPVTQGDYKNILQTVQSVVSSSVGSVSMSGIGRGGPNAMGIVSGAASLVGSIGSAVEDMVKPNITTTGNLSSSCGYLSVKTAYLTILTPRLCIPEHQQEYMGFPIFADADLASLIGFTEIEKIHYEGFTCTDSELEELDEMLKNGVIF